MSDQPPQPTPAARPDRPALDSRAYWHANLRLVLSLLALWFFFSFGCGILLADALDQIRIGGFKLGFWFAQQGSIFSFVVIIFIYMWRMDRLDARFQRSRQAAAKEERP